MNIIILNTKATIGELCNVIEAFQKQGYEAFYDFKNRYLRTKAGERTIKKISKKFPCMQSYNIIK